MDEIMFFSGVIIFILGILALAFALVWQTRHSEIVAKQDALMKKLIEIKNR